MSAGVPALPFEVDPLIAEAKQRARRRRLLALGVAVVVAAATTATLATHSSANSLGVCATPPSGFQVRTVTDAALAPPTVVLTNFRFGRMDYLYGLTGRRHWPANGVTVAVSNIAPVASPAKMRTALLLSRGDFGGMEGAQHPSGQVTVSSNGRILNAYVEVGALTPATIVAANEALAGVRVCSA